MLSSTDKSTVNNFMKSVSNISRRASLFLGATSLPACLSSRSHLPCLPPSLPPPQLAVEHAEKIQFQEMDGLPPLPFSTPPLVCHTYHGMQHFLRFHQGKRNLRIRLQLIAVLLRSISGRPPGGLGLQWGGGSWEMTTPGVVLGWSWLGPGWDVVHPSRRGYINSCRPSRTPGIGTDSEYLCPVQ